MATPPDFTSGQILTAAQMNAVGMWLVKSSSFAATDLIADSVFTTDYTRYVLKATIAQSNTAAEIRLQYRTGGVSNATNNYVHQNTYFTTVAAFDRNTVATSSALLTQNIGGSGWQITLDIANPALAVNTITTGTGNVNTGTLTFIGGTGFLTTTTFDGIRIYPTLGTITGTYTIHGYND